MHEGVCYSYFDIIGWVRFYNVFGTEQFILVEYALCTIAKVICA
jgi:hypothetical protein